MKPGAMRILARSTPQSDRETTTDVDLGFARRWAPKVKDFAQYAVAAVVTGKLRSAFPPKTATSRDESRVLVVSSSQFFANPFARAATPGDDTLGRRPRSLRAAALNVSAVSWIDRRSCGDSPSMKIGLMVVTLVGWGCGGEVDPSAVLTLDGELRNMEDLYDDPAATGTAGARGVRELHQLDPNQQLNSARLDFLENGRLRVSPLSRDHGEDTRIELWGGYRTCALGERWRLVDERRLGLLFACKDGLAREAVFRSASKITIASTVERSTSLLELESVGSDRIVAGDPHPRWGTYEFGLRTPD